MTTVTPGSAGWEYAGLQVLTLAPGSLGVVETGDTEMFVLPLAGGLTVEVADAATPDVVRAAFELAGRDSVFTRVTDFAYVGRDSVVHLVSAAGAEVALPSARCERQREPRYGPAEKVSVEVRGAGPATRQVTNFGTPGHWDHAERLMACELITPGGNWSSYPPHKHDATDPCQVQNEEIYFFKVAGEDGITPSATGFGVHRTFTGPEHAAAGLAEVDDTLVVRDGDAYCIPHGYHGPSIAAPGYDLYYLNVLAGPGPERSMAFCDDPEHGWVRDTWAETPPDPRCPVTGPEGRLSGGTR